MTPEAFETSLIAQIELLQLPVLPYPRDPKSYYPEHDPGEVLVRYEGRKILERDIAGQLSKVRLYAEIVVVTRQVREVGGAYDWLSRIYDALEGFTMDGAAGPLFMEVESFMDEKDGLWQFGQKWSMICAVETRFDEDILNEVLFKSTTSFPHEFPFVLYD